MSVSPGLHPNGFPLWYADTPGNQLGLCVDDPVLCPGVPPFTSADLKGPDGEAFYYLATSEPVPAGGGTVFAVLGVEGAFGDQTTPNVFTRIRFVFSPNAAPGKYTIKHPWGTETVTYDGVKNQGADIGCFPVLNQPCDFTVPTLGPVNNWLKASNAPTDAAGKLIAYGDGATPTTVTGGNLEDVVGADGLIHQVEVNTLTVTGPDGRSGSTPLWTVMGKLFDPAAPVLNPPAPAPPRPGPKPPAADTIVPTVPASAQAIRGARESSLSVSRLSLARRISVARLRRQGLRATMRVPQGAKVVRIAVYKARNGQRTGPALFVTTRTLRATGLYRVTLRNARLLRRLKAGSYVMEVRTGRRAASVGSARRIAFTVTL